MYFENTEEEQQKITSKKSKLVNFKTKRKIKT